MNRFQSLLNYYYDKIRNNIISIKTDMNLDIIIYGKHYKGCIAYQFKEFAIAWKEFKLSIIKTFQNGHK